MSDEQEKRDGRNAEFSSSEPISGSHNFQGLCHFLQSIRLASKELMRSPVSSPSAFIHFRRRSMSVRNGSSTCLNRLSSALVTTDC